MNVTSLGFFGNVMEGIKHQQGVLELFGSSGGQCCVVQQLHQSGDVVTALHGAQQLNCALFGQQRRGGFALGDSGEETGLDVGGFVYARRDAIGEQVKQKLFFTCRRVFQQINQTCSLFGVQRLRNDALSSALFNVFAIGFKHSYYPHQSVPIVSERSSSRTPGSTE